MRIFKIVCLSAPKDIIRKALLGSEPVIMWVKLWGEYYKGYIISGNRGEVRGLLYFSLECNEEKIP